MSGTGSNSLNPTIVASKKSGSSTTRYLAWEEYSEIKYSSLSGTTIGTIENISDNTYYTNHKPSIALYSISNNPVVIWISENRYTYVNNVQLKIKFVGGGYWSSLYAWGYGGGDNVTNASINNNIDGKFVLAWGGEENNQYLTSKSVTNIFNLSTYGDVQVSNAESSMGDMQVSAYNTITSPHYFSESAVTQGTYKTINDTSKDVSKGMFVSTPKGKVKFGIGSIKLNGQPVLFSNSNFDSTSNKFDNNTLYTEPLTLSDNSSLIFSSSYQPADTNMVIEDQNAVKFNVRLDDASTNSVVGDLLTQRLSNDANQNVYSVDCNGIGARTVRLAFDVHQNQGDNVEIYNLITSKGNRLNKEKIKTISYMGTSSVNDYSLSQNYPNPFNPTTQISYQVPTNGFVTLKVYDVLGNAVQTLVDGYQQIGKYNITFDGSKLASGVYFYTIKVNDFSATKKLILLK